MKVKETAAKKRERFNSNICTCGHCQAWHMGKVSHSGPCLFPGCKCDCYRHPR